MNNPTMFWSTLLMVAVLVVGIIIGRQAQIWYLNWKASQKAKIIAGSPSTMRQRIKELERLTSELVAEKDGLLVQHEAQRIEIKRLVDRNKMLSNEVRYDPKAKTEHLSQAHFARTRWKLVTEDIELPSFDKNED